MTKDPIDPESTPTFHPAPEDVLECARSIRPELEELLGSEAEQLDRKVSELLVQANKGQQVDARILDLLKQDEATYYWMAEFLSQPQESKGLQPLPGIPKTSSAKKYICPIKNDYNWYRRSIEIPVRTCPTCNVLLVPANEG